MAKKNNAAPPRRIIGFFDFLSHTGFGTVSQNLVDRLIPFFIKNNIILDIAPLNIRPEGDYFWYKPGVVRVLNHYKYSRNPNDSYGRDGLLQIMKAEDYDLLWYINDVGILSQMITHPNNVLYDLKQGKFNNDIPKKFNILAYMPIDSPPHKKWIEPFWNNPLNIDIVAYCYWGQDQMALTQPSTFCKNGEIDIIPHGVATCFINSRKPGTSATPVNVLLNNQKSYREILGLPVDDNVIVFGNINANYFRKDIPATIQAFKKLTDSIQANPQPQYSCFKPVLYLHCNKTHDNLGYDLGLVLDQCGLKEGENVFFRNKDAEPLLSDNSNEAMLKVYQALDCYITTTTAEGWGLTVHEAKSVGLPVCHPRHTALNELRQSSFENPLTWDVDLDNPVYLGNDGDFPRYKSNPEDVSRALYTAYLYCIEYKLWALRLLTSNGYEQNLSAELINLVSKAHLLNYSETFNKISYIIELEKKAVDSLSWGNAAKLWERKILSALKKSGAEPIGGIVT